MANPLSGLYGLAANPLFAMGAQMMSNAAPGPTYRAPMLGVPQAGLGALQAGMVMQQMQRQNEEYEREKRERGLQRETMRRIGTAFEGKPQFPYAPEEQIDPTSMKSVGGALMQTPGYESAGLSMATKPPTITKASPGDVLLTQAPGGGLTASYQVPGMRPGDMTKGMKLAKFKYGDNWQNNPDAVNYAESIDKRPLVETSVTVGENEFAKAAARRGVDEIMNLRDQAQSAIKTARTSRRLLGLIDQGIKTGAFANWRTALHAALLQTGFNRGADEVSNTQAYGAVVSGSVGQIIQQFGAGTGLSDADREFARKAAGGEITFTEDALRKILEIHQVVAAEAVSKYHKTWTGMSKEKRESFGFDLQLLPRPATPAEAAQLSPGEMFVSPDGQLRMRP